MEQELARKRPARVISGETAALPDLLRLGGQSLAEVQLKANRLYRMGRVKPEYTVRQVDDRRWEAVVTIKARSDVRGRIWVKSLAIFFGIAAFLAAGYFVLQALIIAVAAAVPFIVGGLLLLGAISIVAGRRIINITQNVTIK